jgi:DNA sulfur modification protein DndC
MEAKIKQLIDNGALFACNHSGGKDSQAMYLYLKSIVPAAQLVVIHSHLREVEWDGVTEHIMDTIDCDVHDFHIVEARRSFLQMVEERGMFPSPANRQCTSDLKAGPINKKIRQICNSKGFTIVVNCMGMRAQESPARAKKDTWRINEKQTNSKRTWYEWLPIHDLTTNEVFEWIEYNGQKPHWAYAAGMTRLSCCFCIMASEQDLATASRLRPKLFRRYNSLERTIGRTMMMPSKSKGRRYLDEIVADYEKKQLLNA